MREIKFRAYCSLTKSMINDYCVLKENEFIGYDMTNNTHYIESVMQFTGLYDKNGKEIYEGDILDFDANEWGEPNFVSVVTWDEIDGCWDWGGGNISDLKEWRAVVGNKFENPELLEQK